MKMFGLKATAFAALIGTVAAVSSAHATTFNVALEYNDPAVVNDNAFVLAPNTGRLRIFNETSGALPVSVTGFADGDTIALNVTFGGSGLSLQDLGNPFIGPVEFMSFGALLLNGWDQLTDNPSNATVMTLDTSTTITITGFTGSLTNTVFNASATGVVAVSPSLVLSQAFDFTTSNANITSLTFSRTFSNIQFVSPFDGLSLPNDFTGLASALVLDDSAGVPAPGALALLGLGVFGVGAVRRRETKQAA